MFGVPVADVLRGVPSLNLYPMEEITIHSQSLDILLNDISRDEVASCVYIKNLRGNGKAHTRPKLFAAVSAMGND